MLDWLQRCWQRRRPDTGTGRAWSHAPHRSSDKVQALAQRRNHWWIEYRCLCPTSTYWQCWWSDSDERTPVKPPNHHYIGLTRLQPVDREFWGGGGLPENPPQPQSYILLLKLNPLKTGLRSWWKFHVNIMHNVLCDAACRQRMIENPTWLRNVCHGRGNYKHHVGLTSVMAEVTKLIKQLNQYLQQKVNKWICT